MKGTDNINIKGYKCTAKNRKSDGDGVCILVSYRIANSTTEDNECEIKWINRKSRPRNIAIGVFYGPQINDEAEKIRDIYFELETQIKQKLKKNEIITGGDFNARLDIKNEASNQTENSNEKKLQRIIENNSLIQISTKAQYGLWTRVNRNNTEERSVINYIITTEAIERNTTSLVIDKKGTLRIKGKIKSDHNTILMAIKVNNPRKREYITKKLETEK